MDFLDPKRKKAHRQRLLFGYVLMAIAVAMGTLILLFSAYGYDIDRKTGDIIQNGTVFVDSKPGGSVIELDGVVQHNRTAARLVLPGSHQYTLKLTSDGYQDWSRTFSLEGGRIERLTYPLLIPKQLVTSDVQLYAKAPGISSQSPDRRWLLVQQPDQTMVFDLFDLNNPANAPATVTLPTGLLTDATQTSSISVVEWSDDNRHVLIDRTYGHKHEFIVLDIENAASSININTALGVTPDSVNLRDDKPDQLYLYNVAGGVLRSGDTKNRNISAPLLANVLAFKTYGSEVILYVTKEGAEDGKADFRMRDNDRASYLLRSVPDSSNYIMDISEYDSTPYYVVGSETIDAAFVYRDPLPALKGQLTSSLMVTSVLRIKAPRFVSFSESGQFVSVQNANDLTVIDLEGDRQFKVNLPHPISETYEISWMDDHRFVFLDNGISYMVDFDGSNEQPLVSSAPASGPYFAPDFKSVFTLAPSASVSGRYAFTQTSLIKK